MLYYDERTDSYVTPQERSLSEANAQTRPAPNTINQAVDAKQSAREARVQELMKSKLYHLRKQQKQARHKRDQWAIDYLEWKKNEDEDVWNSDAEATGPAEHTSSFLDALRFSQQFMKAE